SSSADLGFEYGPPTAVGIGDGTLVAMGRRDRRTFVEDLETTSVRAGSAPPLAEVKTADKAVTTGGYPQLAAIGSQAYMSWLSGAQVAGAPLGADNSVDPSKIIPLDHDPTVTRVGQRFIAATFPDRPIVIVFDSFPITATFITQDGRRDGDLVI